ncbi:hypothetical protein TNCV_939151 [Trichonephila clavipes]|nr:hypothetical protein TNCV_939151 [Trichonephila clavipes]
MVLKANDRRTSCPCHDEFRGPRSDYVRQGRVAVYRASTPQVCGSIPGLDKTDHQIGTSVHAPQRPMVTYIRMGTIVPVPHGLLYH